MTSEKEVIKTEELIEKITRVFMLIFIAHESENYLA